MFWGCFNGSQKGPSLFWEKAWGSINGARYRERIVPLVSEWVTSNPGLLFMQDNARPHSARDTRRALQEGGVEVIYWPAWSPDLNPIESVWARMEYWIQEYYPDISDNPCSYNQLRRIVIEAWEAITPEHLQSIVNTMRHRCEAVIAAQGGHTLY